MGHEYGNFQPSTMMDYYLGDMTCSGYDQNKYIDERGGQTTREIIIIKEVHVEKGHLKRELINPVIFL